MASPSSTIGDRLREERERLGFSQTDFARLAASSKHSQIGWEKNTAAPNARYLASIADAGADVLYVVTGERKTAAPGAFNAELLRQVVDGAESALQAKRLRLSPAKKAELVILLYEHFKGAGSVERPTVERFLRLVA